MQKFKRLFIDLETIPNIVYTWRVGYKQNIPYENIIQERRIISMAWAWNNGPINVEPWNRRKCDLPIVAVASRLFAEADEVVAHNGRGFDLPWLRSRAAFHRIESLPDPPLVDTCLLARRRFFFNSNAQDYLSKYLNHKAKIKTNFQLWVDVMAGDKKALAKMVRYNKRDINLLRGLYKRLEPFCGPGSHVGVAEGRPNWSCPYCGSVHVKQDKVRATAKGYLKYQFQCNRCHKFYSAAGSVYRAYVAAKGE